MAEFIISICGGQFEFHNEPVHLVDADGDGHTLLNRMFDQALCVQHHLGRDTQRSGLCGRLKDIICTESARVGKEQEGENRNRVTYSLCCINEEDNTVRDPDARRHLVREVHVTFEGDTKLHHFLL